MENLAEDVTNDAYERVPVEDFGKNIIKGLGWKEGEAIGKNSNGLAKPIQYLSRQKGLGLGATPLNKAQIKGMKNLGKDMSGKRAADAAYTGGQHSKNFITTDEKMKVEEVLKVGSKVYIYKGQHKGLLGIVTKMYTPQESGIVNGKEEDRTELTVELDISHTEVVVKMNKVVLESKRKELQERGIIAKEETKDSEMDSEVSDKSSSRSSSVESNKKKSKKKSKKSKKSKHKSKKKKRKRSSSSDGSRTKRRHKKDNRKRIKWVMPGIIVRVVSQKYMGGKLYNTKVAVQQVNGPDDIVVLKDNKEIFEGLSERYLETIMPKLQEDVRVVKGDYRGNTGKLLERDKKKNKVRLMLNNTTFDIVEMTQDDCCKLS
ncbi:unnamed protein product [Moneuplotes crassus]|uniref:G-patch domain-containing protein n=1 Tax=Euplotes crassus TaxID=5936 RepID=A0AAD1UMZ9_EUPCR|nr:unnamed protein product [Moneuplotes crassus]